MKRAIFFVMLLLLLIGAIFYSGGALLQIISSFNFSSLYTNSASTAVDSQTKSNTQNKSTTTASPQELQKNLNDTSQDLSQGTSKNISPDTALQLSPQTIQKLKVLEEIFNSKDDNDARLDSEFKNMTPELKDALRDRFSQTVPEQLNRRGTFLFLLGREINSREDVDFFSRVVEEPVCLSVENCNRANPASQASSALLAYPQMVSLIGLQRTLEQGDIDPALRDQILQKMSGVAANNIEPMATLAKEILNQQKGQ